MPLVKQNKDMAYRSMLLLQSRVHIRTETVPVLWRTGIPLVPVCGRRAYGHLPWAGYKDCRFHLDDIRSVGHYNNLGFYRKRSEHKYRNANFHHKYLKKCRMCLASALQRDCSIFITFIAGSRKKLPVSIFIDSYLSFFRLRIYKIPNPAAKRSAAPASKR